MNLPAARHWLVAGRPRLAIALLVLAFASILMLLYEGSRAPADLGLPSFRGLDKVLHFGAHLWVSGLMFTGAVLFGRPPAMHRRLWVAALIVLAVDGLAGLGVELVQAAGSQGRVFDWKDLAANIAGTVAAIAIGTLAAVRLTRAPRQEFR
jgi:hypothetical protein